MTNKNYDEETSSMMQFALEDLQSWMANTAGRNTTEDAIIAWQAGYIAGATRAIGVRSDQMAQEEA